MLWCSTGNVMLMNLGYAVKSKEMGSCALFLFLMFYLGWYIAGEWANVSEICVRLRWGFPDVWLIGNPVF